MPVKIFFCYAHEDKPFRDELDRHLKVLKDLGLIRSWYDGEIVPDDPWEEVIKEHLNRAQIVLLLISVSFLNADYCYRIEMEQALERHNAGIARVIPVLLRSVYWEGTPISKLQMLPTGAKPITLWSDQDAAFTDVVEGILRAVNEMLQKQRSRGAEMLAKFTLAERLSHSTVHISIEVSADHESSVSKITSTAKADDGTIGHKVTADNKSTIEDVTMDSQIS